MIPGAIHIPLGKILENPKPPQLANKSQVLVYCRAGIRSAKAVTGQPTSSYAIVSLCSAMLSGLSPPRAVFAAACVTAMQAQGIHCVNLGGGYLAWQGDK